MENLLKGRTKAIEILIVDDAPENLRTLTRILRETNYHVTTVSSGEQALEIVNSNKPDLILLDVRMPGMDGFEVCKRIKADSQTSNIPIIFISALDQIDDKKKGFELGASDYILKPFQGEEVILRINNLLKISLLQEKLLNNAKMEMTKEKEKSALTRRIIEVAEDYLQNTSSQIDYQKITDEIWEISGAKFVTFNLFNEDGDKFTTLTISGKSSLLKMGNSLISTKMLGKQWDNDLARYEKIKDRNVTKFDSLKELAGDVVGKPIIELIEKTFGLGSIYLIKIMRNEIMLGDFTIIMEKNEEIKNVDILEIYTRQLGLFLSRAKEEEQVRYLSFHDQLTGLYNRRFYEEELRRMDTERNYPLTIVIGDCNGLKLVNDSFGHIVGDQLIKRSGELIKLACRSDDVIARLGGDEFVIILPKAEKTVAENIIKRINSMGSLEKIGLMEISIAFGCGTKNSATEDINNVFKRAEDEMYKRKLFESNSVKSDTIDLIMNTLFEKSSREMLHSQGVSSTCVSICNQMGLNKDSTNKIRIAGLMHDIGKISLDISNLNISKALTKEEIIAVNKHPEVGYRLLSVVNEFSSIADSVLQHHERWDGLGYPKGLKKEEICLEARIISVADAFDSMTNEYSYKKILTQEEAIKEIKEGAGTQFDPVVVEALLKSYYI